MCTLALRVDEQEKKQRRRQDKRGLYPSRLFTPFFFMHNPPNLFYNQTYLHIQIAENPAFNDCREAIDHLAGEIRAFEARLVEYQTRGLPQQIIHGDLHYDNVLVEGDTVSGLLDFEVGYMPL
jgi:Ser/Thr protein kinase RdoA (MazF antagonist)